MKQLQRRIFIDHRVQRYCSDSACISRLFGSGIALGGGSCGIKGIFGYCHDKSKSNAENFQKQADFTEALTEVFLNYGTK